MAKEFSQELLHSKLGWADIVLWIALETETALVVPELAGRRTLNRHVNNLNASQCFL